MSELTRYIGGNIRRARGAAGLTQVGLAQASGVAQQTIAGAESGKHDLRVETLFGIARALGTTITELLTEPRRCPTCGQIWVEDEAAGAPEPEGNGSGQQGGAT